MHRLAILLFISCGLASCVTEQSYMDAEKNEKKLQFDKAEAAKSRVILALSYLNKNNNSQAKLNLDKALEFAPQLPQVHSARGYYFQQIGDNTLAQQAYKKAMSLAPSNPDTLHNYGTFLCQQGEFTEAQALLTSAIKSQQNSQTGRSLYNLAICQMELRQYQAALDNLVKANKYEPSAADIMYLGASINYGKENFSSSLSWFQEYQAQTNLDADGLLLGVSLYQRLGLNQQSEVLQQTLAAQYPQSKAYLLLNTSQMAISRHELLRKKISGKSDLPIAVHASIELSGKARAEIKDGIHALRVLNKEADLPEETLVYEESDAKTQQVITRVPILTIPDRKITVPRYKVQTGENLYRVSLKFNIQMNTLMSWNKLKKQQVNAGQLLYIHNPDVYYVVDNEEMLSTIAKRLQINLDKLMSWNQVQHDGLVRAGTKIIKVDVEQFEP